MHCFIVLLPLLQKFGRQVHFYSESIIDSFVELVKCGRTTNFPEDIFIWRYFCFPPYLSKQVDSVESSRVDNSTWHCAIHVACRWHTQDSTGCSPNEFHVAEVVIQPAAFVRSSLRLTAEVGNGQFIQHSYGHTDHSLACVDKLVLS